MTEKLNEKANLPYWLLASLIVALTGGGALAGGFGGQLIDGDAVSRLEAKCEKTYAGLAGHAAIPGHPIMVERMDGVQSAIRDIQEKQETAHDNQILICQAVNAPCK